MLLFRSSRHASLPRRSIRRARARGHHCHRPRTFSIAAPARLSCIFLMRPHADSQGRKTSPRSPYSPKMSASAPVQTVVKLEIA